MDEEVGNFDLGTFTQDEEQIESQSKRDSENLGLPYMPSQLCDDTESSQYKSDGLVVDHDDEVEVLVKKRKTPSLLSTNYSKHLLQELQNINTTHPTPSTSKDDESILLIIQWKKRQPII